MGELMNDIINYLLPFSISIFVFVIGVILFKNFLKIIVIVSLIIGGIAFYSQDAFAGISDFLSGKPSVNSSSKEKRGSNFLTIQNDEGSIFIIKRKKYTSMEIIEGRNVILFDKTRKYDFGEISDPTIENIIKTLFGSPELLNVEEGDEE